MDWKNKVHQRCTNIIIRMKGVNILKKHRGYKYRNCLTCQHSFPQSYCKKSVIGGGLEEICEECDVIGRFSDECMIDLFFDCGRQFTAHQMSFEKAEKTRCKYYKVDYLRLNTNLIPNPDDYGYTNIPFWSSEDKIEYLDELKQIE